MATELIPANEAPGDPTGGGFKLSDVVPWGRCRAEYLSFFDLLDLAPGPRLLDAAGGPSSFNAEMTELGFDVVSADPLYGVSKPAIKGSIELTRPQIMARVRATRARFNWDAIGTPEALEAMRLSAMKLFLEDFEDGLAEERYVDAVLPDLPFADGAFDIALCSHFLFTYSDHLDLDFHLAACRDLVRLAPEVRIFPMLNMDGSDSVHLEPVLDALGLYGLEVEVRRVGYEFQRGGNRMLRLTRRP